MKLTHILMLSTSLLSMRIGDSESRMTLICRQWKQVAIKNEAGHIDKGTNQVVAFNSNGYYESDLGNGLFKGSGRWYFMSDSTALGYEWDVFKAKSQIGDTYINTDIKIIELTSDTLILRVLQKAELIKGKSLHNLLYYYIPVK